MAKKIDEDAGLLYDFAVTHPTFTYEDIDNEFGWARAYFFRVVRMVRLILADDEINVVCEPRGSRESWEYKLVGNPEGARRWSSNRIGDLESRLETVHSVARTVASATDGRSIEGRKARKIENTVGYLLRELADIAA